MDSSSASYSSILTALSNARGDLERTVAKLNGLESENASLLVNYNKLKDDLTETKKRMNEARDNYLKLSDEKVERDKQSELFLERLKDQLAEKTAEFELLRDKFAPQDLDFVRIKVQEELELPHKMKVQSLTEEIDSLRDNNSQLRRELDRTKTEFAANTENQRREIAALRSEHDSVVASLHNQIVSLQERDYLPERDDQLRHLKTRVTELQSLLEATKEEIRLLTLDRDNSILKSVEVQSKIEESASRLKAKLVVAESERHAAEQKLAISLLDFDKKEALLRHLKNSVEDLTSDLERANKQVHDLEVKLGDSQADSSRHLLDIQQLFENERREHGLEIDRLNGRLNEREEVLRRAQREAAEMQLRAETIETDIRRSYHGQLQEMTKKYSALEAAMLGDRTGVQLTDMQKMQHIEKLESELSTMRLELQQIHREKEALLQRSQDEEYQAEMMQQKYAKLKHSSTVTISGLQTELAATKSKITELEVKLVEEAIVDQDLKARLQASEDHIERCNSENAKLKASLRDSMKQLQSLDQQCITKLEHMRESFRSQLSREKKKADTYKLKALEAHQKWKEAATLATAAAFGERRQGEHPVIYIGGSQAPPPQPIPTSTVAPASEKLTLKMEAQVEAWERKCQALDLELGKARIREEDLSSTITRLRNEIVAITDIKQRANDRVAELEGIKKTQATQIMNLEASLRKETERAIDLDNAKGTLRTQLSNLEATARQSADRVQELESAKKGLLTTIESLELAARRDADRLCDLENAKKSLQSQLASTEQSVRREAERSMDLEKTKSTLLSQISILEHASRREVDKALEMESSKKSIQSQLQTVEHSLRLESEQRASALANERLLREELERLKARVTENSGLVQLYQHQQKQSHIALLEQEALKRRPAELEHEISLLKVENELLQKKVTDANTDLASSRSRVVDIQRQNAAEVELLKVENAKLQRKCEEQAEEILSLKGKLVEYNSKPDYEKDLLLSRTENANLTKKKIELERELELRTAQGQSISQLRDENERLRNRNAELESSRSQFEVLRDDFERRKASTDTELSRLRLENVDLRRQLNDMTPELQMLRSQLGMLEDAVLHDSTGQALHSHNSASMLRRSYQRS